MFYDAVRNDHGFAVDPFKALVAPRPIAWVSSLSAGGIANLAPFSFFMGVGSDPPTVALSVGNKRDGSMKDTARNILATKRFTVCMVPEAAAERMNVTATDIPPEVDELALAGLTEEPFGDGAPRIGESPVAFDCELYQTIPLGRHLVVLGRVLAMEIRDDCVLDAARHYVDTPRLGLIGRTGGGGGYVRLTDRMEMPRLTPEQAMARARR
jgi:flavin reductase (DIM6/NTAB) family NADH-FMN oxidoreductase RutF